MEAILLSNQVASAGSAAAARTLGGLQTWINTNGEFASAGTAVTSVHCTGRWNCRWSRRALQRHC